MSKYVKMAGMMKKTFGEYKSFGKATILTLIGLCAFTAVSGAILAKNSEPSSSAISLFGTSYKDGKTVPIKTFAGALVKALNLPLGTKTKCYSDLKKNDNSKEICTLKAAKIFPNTKKISPNNTVTFDFALTSLCKAKNWTTKQTYASCLSYAKKQKFLASPMPSKISKNKKLTYQQLAAFIERSVPINVTGLPNNGSAGTPPSAKSGDPEPEFPLPPSPPSPPTNVAIPQRTPTSLTFSPVAETQIGPDFFANIRLSSPLATRFYKDEIYFVEGDVTGMSANEVFIFLCREGQGCDDSINFIEDTSNGHFRIPVHFSGTGNFQVGIIPGRSGESKISDISVLPEPETLTSGGRQATSLSAKYENGKTVFSWNGEGSLTRLVIAQNGKRKDYLFRQGARSFAPDSKDFAGFAEGWAAWQVSQDSAMSDTKNIYLVKQELRKVESGKIQVKALTETYESPVLFTFSAKSLAPIAKKIAYTLPNGSVKEFNFSENDLPAGRDFTIEQNFSSPGTYIFEVNDPEGSAVVNVPIYIGDRVPLLPDFFALDETTLNRTPLADLSRSRQQLLLLINTDRAMYSLPAVTLADDLNTVAQGHSQNMVNLSFFGHVDPAGNSPDNRRKNSKIPTPIRENLGKATSLESVEAGLMRSPIHRAAILDPDMQRVGLGIVKDAEGYFIVTQNFAQNPVNLSDLPTIANSLLTQAKTYRSENGLPDIERDSLLDDLAGSWALRMATENFFGVSDPAGQKLLDTVRTEGVTSSIQIHLSQVSDKKQLGEELLKQAALADRENRKIGLGLSSNDIGELFLTAIYTP